jgi:hypothetical protein
MAVSFRWKMSSAADAALGLAKRLPKSHHVAGVDQGLRKHRTNESQLVKGHENRPIDDVERRGA